MSHAAKERVMSRMNEYVTYEYSDVTSNTLGDQQGAHKSFLTYRVASISRLLKITGLFCKKALFKRLYSAQETYNLKEPTNRSHSMTLSLLFNHVGDISPFNDVRDISLFNDVRDISLFNDVRDTSPFNGVRVESPFNDVRDISPFNPICSPATQKMSRVPFIHE